MQQAAPQRILVITLRRLGDVLLTTPLVHSLRAAWPATTIDMLVFRGTEGMLAGNPDIANIVTMPERPSFPETLGLIARLWRRYDLAVATHGGDRPTAAAWIAGRKRAGILNQGGLGNWIKQWLFHHWAPHNRAVHRVEELLRLADALGIAREIELVCPQGATTPAPGLAARYAVLHANPKFVFRRWNAPGWRNLAAALAQRRLQVVATGGADAAERAYLDSIWQDAGTPIMRLDGRLNWPQLTALLRGAAVYVGPDTSVTHLAAGAGCPAVAIYGPASPSIIGPWPRGGLAETWAPAGHIQHRANVWVVQNPLSCPFSCLPCERLGCDNHYTSHAQCLDELGVDQVLTAVDAALLTATAGVS